MNAPKTQRWVLSGLSWLMLFGYLLLSRALGAEWVLLAVLMLASVLFAAVLVVVVRRYLSAPTWATRQLFAGIIVWLGALPPVVTLLAALADPSKAGTLIDAAVVLGTLAWLLATYLVTLLVLAMATQRTRQAHAPTHPGGSRSRRVTTTTRRAT